MESYIIAASGIVSMMVLWIVIQFLWRKVFPEYTQDEDILADRTKCSHCGCTTACKNKRRLLNGGSKVR